MRGLREPDERVTDRAPWLVATLTRPRFFLGNFAAYPPLLPPCLRRRNSKAPALRRPKTTMLGSGATMLKLAKPCSPGGVVSGDVSPPSGKPGVNKADVPRGAPLAVAAAQLAIVPPRLSQARN